MLLLKSIPFFSVIFIVVYSRNISDKYYNDEEIDSRIVGGEDAAEVI